MGKAIELRVKKDLDARQHNTIIKFKGSLISKGYTEIIHILDEDEEYHINKFETTAAQNNEVYQYISAFISSENLSDTISFR